MHMHLWKRYHDKHTFTARNIKSFLIQYAVFSFYLDTYTLYVSKGRRKLSSKRTQMVKQYKGIITKLYEDVCWITWEEY